jgi:hypothetical protein
LEAFGAFGPAAGNGRNCSSGNVFLHLRDPVFRSNLLDGPNLYRP